MEMSWGYFGGGLCYFRRPDNLYFHHLLNLGLNLQSDSMATLKQSSERRPQITAMRRFCTAPRSVSHRVRRLFFRSFGNACFIVPSMAIQDSSLEKLPEDELPIHCCPANNASIAALKARPVMFQTIPPTRKYGGCSPRLA